MESKNLFFYELEGRGYTFQNKNWDEAKHGFEDDMLNMAWEMWSSGQAAKAQVPEGFVLVSEDQAKDTDRLNFLLGGETYIRTVTHRDIQNDEYEKIGEHFQLTEVFWIDGFDYWENTSSNSERGAIDKAMIEAQEQSND